MKYKLPVGVSDFKKIATGNYVFTDKTLLIKEVMEDGADIILVTRPRRFGKTLNLSMLYYFLDHSQPKSENLFEKLNIGQDKAFCEEHQNQYPVIFISFKDVKQSTYRGAYEDIVCLIMELYEVHRYLLEVDGLLSDSEARIFKALMNREGKPSDIKSALRRLCLYMYRKYEKNPIILIDEYDTPIQEAYLHKYYEKMVELMRGILGQALKDNSYLTKAVVTGITRISQESLFSGLNNIEVYSLLREDYGQYFGFTEEEVLKLLEETKQGVSLDAIKEWYNGYQIGKHVLYNPWSIIKCLKNHGQLEEYWVNTSGNGLIGDLLKSAGGEVKREFEELLQGKVITQPLCENLVLPEIEERPEALWSLLVYAGYLKVLNRRLEEETIAELCIPNKEVSFVYSRAIKRWFTKATIPGSYDSFVRSLMDGDMEKFEMYITSYIMQSGSYFDFNKNTPEQVFHVFILGLVVGLRGEYYIRSNQESGLGRFDVVMLPKQSGRAGILLEFKATDDPKKLKAKAKEGLKQVKDNQYLELFRQNGVKEVLAIGLAFCGKQVSLVNEKVVV
ncbi:AAA family ATPase [Rickettsiales endosymbiont of Peranema trichophorum]|uniref:AAA family ATPase n=1 Tax=Rickettsiales endosymbiont of Peranema trichophorum TaxID=2486577 RepID=UPI0010234C7F|nr:AAA family ATPase [Rickettsiales endosymbiont of Peranema trichophorum]RZI46357.1 AAA family ATPase [Rickettsiales endosymbiont of Peranema trichophorum]